MNLSSLHHPLVVAVFLFAGCAQPTPWSDVPLGEKAGAPAPELQLVMLQDYASPMSVSFLLAWETAQKDPAQGLRDQLPFVARGFPEGTMVRLMARRRDPQGGDGPALVVAQRETRPALTVNWFADYTHANGGVRILPEDAAEQELGLPVSLLCGTTEMWLEAVGPDGSVLAAASHYAWSRSAAECANTPARW